MLQRGPTGAGPSATPGFTLVELMVTVALLAIITAIALPSFTNLVRSSRLTSSANEMVALLQSARTAAISSRASSSVCPSADGANCAAVLGNRWIARMTKNGVSTILRDTTLHPSIVVRASVNLSGASNTFTFTPVGLSATGAAASGVLGLCVNKLPGNNGIDVSASAGRISTVQRAATAACTAPGDN